jgi:hypothetical protein
MQNVEPQYLREFPSFEDEKLPPIPASWEDSSWHNDMTPCWKTPSGLYVWIGEENPASREMPISRFGVIQYADGDEKISTDQTKTIIDTDSWEEVLAALPEGDRA